MKKIYLFACATLLAFSSCTNEISEDGFVDKTNAISFSAYPTRTRALVAGDVTTDKMKGDHFGVVGYTNHSIYLYKGTNSAVEQEWQASGESGSWEYSNKGDLKFWPNGTMDFYAYFPYSDNATFENNNNPSDGEDLVMTIPSVDCSHDVLFASVGNQSKTDRVPLTFYHAFAKMKKLTIEMPADGILNQSNCQIEVKEVEFIHTSTKGNIKVNAYGIASYDVASSNVTLSEDLSSSLVTVNSSTTTGTLINNLDTESKGYFFATNNVPENNVMGTNKTMWDGVKGSIITSKLSTSGLVCLKLTCKVWNGTESNKYYYVGDDSNYEVIYIPVTGNDTTTPSTNITTFDAGKRYTYKIVMKDNVGYTDEGDPILTPILFSVTSVDAWEDVEVTITL